MTIDIIAPPELLANSISENALNDFVLLLQSGFPGSAITMNGSAASVQIVLPHITESSMQKIPSTSDEPVRRFLQYPDHSYKWISSRHQGLVVLHLEAASFEGVSCALYGLLQDKLGYLFYHPRGTILPKHVSWPLPDSFVMEGIPRFEKKGFHLHTLHPTELAEQLFDPDHPGALAAVKEYLDWLARNRQNVVQFYLVRGVDSARWTAHAGKIVEYAHQRGILAGIQISISMLQQRAFQAIRLLRPFPSYRKQIDRALDWLFQVKWDFVTVDPLLGEHLPDLSRYLPSTAAYLVRRIADEYKTAVFLSTHVIRGGKEIRGEASTVAEPDDDLPERNLNRSWNEPGVMIHTVMCYSVSEPEAPVYGNRNLRFMLERAMAENTRRESWFWPESSYWITFDNSVPLFLLPYLDVRRQDMEAMEEIGMPGHITFSSGWEWGYWLFDWSIARWSWRHVENRGSADPEPFDSLYVLFPGSSMNSLWKQALELQNLFLKERGLLKYMSALPPFAELFWPFNRPFQPVPEISLRTLLKSGGETGFEELNRVCGDLADYANGMERIIGGLDEEMTGHPPLSDMAGRLVLFGELTRGLKVTVLRARHRRLTILALAAAMGTGPREKEKSRELLAQAAATRQEALELVRRQEKLYRYPVENLARRRKSLTAYGFGYLYPVSTLFFWEREEEQVRRLRFDAFFMNIWDFGRILGLGGLFR